MKSFTPEVAWHNRDPVFSLDIQQDKISEYVYRLASGGADAHIVIWYIEYVNKEGSKGVPKVDFIAELKRHEKSVNIVRFSPSSEFLASGDDDCIIIIWKRKDKSDGPDLENENKEQWTCIKTLRLHLNDVYDICWSPDSTHLISGSVDSTAVLWNVNSGSASAIFKEDKGFVQGVTWDPLQKYVATLSSDRTLRLYSTTFKNLVCHCIKAVLPKSKNRLAEENIPPLRFLFHDDTLKTYFRRLCFSPDGNLLFVPSGIVDLPLIQSNGSVNVDCPTKQSFATFVFLRDNFTEPIMYFPSKNEYSIAVRCCPILFKNTELPENKIIDLPYKMVIAVATKSSVLLYDTEHAAPFGYVTDIHYTRLTDLSWSSDGRLLVISSTDGFCTFITFGENELGIPWQDNTKCKDIPPCTENNSTNAE